MTGPMRLPSSVGWTALNPSVHRARESGRPDALFSDPFSVALVEMVTTGNSGQAPRVPGSGESGEGTRVFGDYVALRTRFIDDSLARVTRDGIAQIVLLGAGTGRPGLPAAVGGGDPPVRAGYG